MQSEKRIGSFYLVLFLIILLLFALFLTFDNYAKTRETRAAIAWADTFGSLEDLPNQCPYRNDNEAADHLKSLAVRLGIDFNIRGEGNQFTPLNSDAARLKGLERDRSGWRSFIVHYETNDRVDPPFPTLAKYLADYGKKLDDVRDYLLTSSPVEWRQNLEWTEYGHANPASPNTYAISRLQNLMAYRILQLASDKNYTEAEKYLEAEWNLNETLKSLCDFESQEWALRSEKWLMSYMRILPLEQNWIQRIVKHDYKKSYMKSFVVAEWFYWRQRNEYQMTKSSVLNNILSPYLRLGVSTQLENDIKELRRLQVIEPCDLGYKEFRESRSSGMSGIPYNWYLYDPVRGYAEITEIELLRELTSKVIKVKHGYFPKDGTERSEACKDGTWEYWRSPDGITIKYKGRIELPYTSPTNFPSTFTVKNF